MLDEGVYTSVSEIGEAEGIDKGYVSRILRLALLAPDIKPKTASLFVSRLNLGHPSRSYKPGVCPRSVK